MKEIETINNDGSKTIKIYSTYTQAQKKATIKYRENNKDKVKDQRKLYYEKRKKNDPAFLEYKRAQAKHYYALKKASKKALKELSEIEKVEDKENDSDASEITITSQDSILSIESDFTNESFISLNDDVLDIENQPKEQLSLILPEEIKEIEIIKPVITKKRKYTKKQKVEIVV